MSSTQFRKNGETSQNWHSLVPALDTQLCVLEGIFMCVEGMMASRFWRQQVSWILNWNSGALFQIWSTKGKSEIKN